MPKIVHTHLDDPELAPFRQLKKSNLTRWSQRFIAEGEKVVERLLASPIQIESLLVSDKREDFLMRINRNVNVFILPHQHCTQLVGFEFHQGVMACGHRPDEQPVSQAIPPGAATVAVAARMTDPDNLGTLLRLASAFGIQAVITGPGSADPWSRRSIRISMGSAFSIPIIQSDNLPKTIRDLKSTGFEIAGTVLDSNAECLASARRTNRLAILFGNEASGLSRDERQLCDRVLTIPMAPTADSLNVSAAAAIFLYHFTRVTPH